MDGTAGVEAGRQRRTEAVGVAGEDDEEEQMGGELGHWGQEFSLS